MLIFMIVNQSMRSCEGEMDVGSSERGQQQCFVKEIREPDDGTLQVTTARSTRSQIRNDFPELHILDYDTGHYLADRLADEAVR
jgi:hypothetical protein